MRSWKTPALLATVGLCGLGSLLAQDPVLPSLSDAPVDLQTSPELRLNAPSFQASAPPAINEPGAMAPQPNYETSPHSSMVEEQALSSSPAYTDLSSMPSAPASSCGGCVSEASAQAASNCGCQTNNCDTAPMMMQAPQVYFAPVAVQASCGCQGGSSAWGSGYGQSQFSGYGHGYPIGSGSGVSSGVLSPNANSGGLHTRYPYYNYRHPWYYQGPPSQNVTIVW
jgi:hypothetical protein